MGSELPHVVVVGGGFGGLEVVRALKGAPCRVTLVDRRNHHLFQPLLYQVATAGLSAVDIAAPIRRILRRQANVTVLLDEAVEVDTEARTLRLGSGSLRWDWLVVAAGATNTWFGRDQTWAPFAPGLKSIEEALEIRRRMLFAYEAAEKEEDEARRRAWLTFVVIGGGPTGVELAGALAEISRTTLTRDFRRFDPSTARVLLVEGGADVLSAFPETLRASAREQLAQIGVELRLGSFVESIDAEGVVVGGERIESRTVVWAAGVRGEPLAGTLGVELDRQGRVPVGPDLSVGSGGRVFAIGDIARFEQDGEVLPGVAPVAMQQGKWAGQRIRRAVSGMTEVPETFRYFDKGSMATIGRRRAVAVMGVGRSWPGGRPVAEFRGTLAWLAWLFVHLMVLVSFRNRMAVFAEWAWAYVTFQRSARLLIGLPSPSERAKRGEGEAVASASAEGRDVDAPPSVG